MFLTVMSSIRPGAGMVNVTINVKNYAAHEQQYTANSDIPSHQNVICKPINLGEQMHVIVDCTPSTLVLQTTTKNELLKMNNTSNEIILDVIEECPHLLVLEYPDSDSASKRVSFKFPVVIPFALLTNEQRLNSHESLYEVIIKCTTTYNPILLRSVHLCTSEMFVATSIDDSLHDNDGGILINRALSFNDTWNVVFRLTHKLHHHQTEQGKLFVKKCPDLGRLELKWDNHGQPGRLQTAPLKRKDVEAVACWMSLNDNKAVIVNQEVVVNVYFQNNSDQPISNVSLRFHPHHILYDHVLPSGAMSCHAAEMFPGERVHRQLKIVCQRPGLHCLDNRLFLTFKTGGIDYKIPREFSVLAGQN